MNLLPEEEKNNIQREYKRRFYTLAVYFLTVSFLLGTVVALPYYISGKAELFMINNRIEQFGEEVTDEETKRINAEFSEFSRKLTLLDPTDEGIILDASKTLETVLAHKPPGVSLTGFAYTVLTDDRTFGQAIISGTAGDRDSLLLFVRDLSAIKDFSSVDLPVSNFSQRTDIDFSVTVVLGEAPKPKSKEVKDEIIE